MINLLDHLCGRKMTLTSPQQLSMHSQSDPIPAFVRPVSGKGEKNASKVGILWKGFYDNYTIRHGNAFIQAWVKKNYSFQLFPTSVDEWTLKKMKYEHCFLLVLFDKWSISNSTSPLALNMQRIVPGYYA